MNEITEVFILNHYMEDTFGESTGMVGIFKDLAGVEDCVSRICPDEEKARTEPCGLPRWSWHQEDDFNEGCDLEMVYNVLSVKKYPLQ